MEACAHDLGGVGENLRRGNGLEEVYHLYHAEKLEQKGVFVNEKGMIRAVYTKEEWQAQESRQFVKDSFGGSLPKFLTAFAKGKGLTAKEVEEMKKLIETYEEG